MAIAISFNVKEYNSGNFSVVTRNGQPVDIISIDEKRATLFGFFENGQPSYWDTNGNFYPGGGEESENDLCLVPKRTTVHVNITRNKHGKIDCYCSTRGKARVQAGGTLLKYIVVDIEE